MAEEIVLEAGQRVFARLNALDWPAEVARPSLETDYKIMPVGPETIPAISANYGISVACGAADNFLVVSNRLARLANRFHITFKGAGNICVLGEDNGIRGGIDCQSGCVAVIMGGQHALNLSATLYHEGQLFWGRGARTYGCRIWTHGGKRVVVGDDCLFSEGISIRTSDHHSIIDLADFSQINQPGDVVIGRHVWVSPNVQIMRGVKVGTGSIIGIGSIVTSNIPPTELWAGVPARQLKQNVSWTDSHPARDVQIAALRDLLRGDAADGYGEISIDKENLVSE